MFVDCEHCGDTIGEGADEMEATDDAQMNDALYTDEGEFVCIDCYAAHEGSD